MEFILEFIFSLLFEGVLELATNKKVSKWIRYPVAIIVLLLYLALVILMLILGFTMLNFSILGAIFLIGIGFVLVYMLVKFYLEKVKF